MHGCGGYSALALVLVVLLSGGIRGTTGLYKEQDGKYNWYKQHVGRYSTIVPCETHSIEYAPSGGFMVSTAEGVVARLSEEEDSVVWRIVLGEGERVLADTLGCGVDYATFASVSEDNRTGTLRVLRASSGKQVWAEVVQAESMATISMSRTARGVLVGAHGLVKYMNLEDGRALWSRGDLVEDASDVHVATVGETMLVSAKKGGRVLLLELQESDGAVLHNKDFEHPPGGTSIRMLRSGHVEVSKDKKRVCFVLLQSGSNCIAVASDSDAVSSVAIVRNMFVIVSTMKKTVVFRVTSSSKAPVIEGTFDNVQGVISNEVNGMVAIGSGQEDQPGIYILKILDDVVQKPRLYPYPTETPAYLNGKHCLPSTIALGQTGLVVQFAEGTAMSFTRDMTQIRWERPESLAYVSQCMFSELPPSNPENEEEWQRKQPPLSQKLFVQLLILKTQLGLGRSIDNKVIIEHQSRTRDILRPTRDIDGFRKQMIVVTKSGKVASLHSGNGEILWQVNIPGPVHEMHVQHWFTSENSNTISIFVTSSSKLFVYLLDGFTGTFLEEHIQVPYSNGVNVMPLDPIVTRDGEQNSYVVLDGSDRVLKVLPFGDHVALSNFEESSAHLIRWGISDDGRSMYGVRLHQPGDVPSLHWKVNIVPEDSEMKILDVSSRDKSEAIYSAAKPIFGGGVLIKNVNPNTLLVVAGGDDHGDIVVVTALDAVTGRILYRKEHKGCNGPVKSIMSEHWVAYTFWQQDQGRWYIGVIDTYFPQPEDLNAVKLLFSRKDTNETVSPYNASPELIVEAESFRTKYSASCLAVTKTAHGTTSKMLLMGTTNGQIVSIDRRMLDPRRPKVLPGTKLTPEQAYERLPPYHPEIAVNGPSFITLYNRIERLRGIETHPATLESSTLVFAYGLDLYFVRMQPSRGFDMVPDDFPHALLVFMVIGLALALSVLRKVIQRRTLRLTWK